MDQVNGYKSCLYCGQSIRKEVLFCRFCKKSQQGMLGLQQMLQQQLQCSSEAMKPCRFCGQFIRSEALLCRYCRKSQQDNASFASAQPLEQQINPAKQTLSQPDLKACPNCGQWIKSIAIKCRFCKQNLQYNISQNSTGTVAGAITSTAAVPAVVATSDQQTNDSAEIPVTSDPANQMAVQTQQDKAPPSDQKTCPNCGQWIKSIAIKCRFCKKNLEDISQPIQQSTKKDYSIVNEGKVQPSESLPAPSLEQTIESYTEAGIQTATETQIPAENQLHATENLSVPESVPQILDTAHLPNAEPIAEAATISDIASLPVVASIAKQATQQIVDTDKPFVSINETDEESSIDSIPKHSVPADNDKAQTEAENSAAITGNPFPQWEHGFPVCSDVLSWQKNQNKPPKKSCQFCGMLNESSSEECVHCKRRLNKQSSNKAGSDNVEPAITIVSVEDPASSVQSLKQPEDNTKPCLFCAEIIKKSAIYCKHCHKDLKPIGDTVQTTKVALTVSEPQKPDTTESLGDASIDELENSLQIQATQRKPKENTAANDTKQCPNCNQTIKKAAMVCRYCRTRFDAATEQRKPLSQDISNLEAAELSPTKGDKKETEGSSESKQKSKAALYAIITLVVVVLLVAGAFAFFAFKMNSKNKDEPKAPVSVGSFPSSQKPASPEPAVSEPVSSEPASSEPVPSEKEPEPVDQPEPKRTPERKARTSENKPSTVSQKTTIPNKAKLVKVQPKPDSSKNSVSRPVKPKVRSDIDW